MFREFTPMFSIVFVKRSVERITLATGYEGWEEETWLY